MGRPPKPVSLKTGKDMNKEEKDKRQEAEDMLTRGVGTDLLYEVPDNLDEIGVYYYNFIVEQMEQSGVLTNIDQPLVAETAQVLQYAYHAKEDIKKYGQLYESYDKYGNVTLKQNPAVSTYNTMLNQFKTFGNMIGLSPTARASIGMLNVQAEVDAKNPLLQALADDEEEDDI